MPSPREKYLSRSAPPAQATEKRPAMRLHVHILDKSFVLNAARERKTLGATVAAQRFDRMARPRHATARADPAVLASAA